MVETLPIVVWGIGLTVPSQLKGTFIAGAMVFRTVAEAQTHLRDIAEAARSMGQKVRGSLRNGYSFHAQAEQHTSWATTFRASVRPVVGADERRRLSPVECLMLQERGSAHWPKEA